MSGLVEQIIDRLQKLYGKPEPPTITDPLEAILFENVAYLVDDKRRRAAFAALKDNVGTDPARILKARPADLAEVIKLGGMLPEMRVDKLRTIALIVMNQFGGDLRKILDLPAKQATKALKLFPGIGDPGAEKILLFARRLPVLALDSNGMRVLVRVGLSAEQTNYGATYRSVQSALQSQIQEKFPWLIAAHQLLRQHGQERCTRTRPLCHSCPLTDVCRFYKTGAQSNSTASSSALPRSPGRQKRP